MREMKTAFVRNVGSRLPRANFRFACLKMKSIGLDVNVMLRIRWTEKASRLAEELNISKWRIEEMIEKSKTRDAWFGRYPSHLSSHRVVFSLKNDEIDAEVFLR